MNASRRSGATRRRRFTGRRWVGALGWLAIAGQALAADTTDWETRVLFGPDSAAGWSAAESTMQSASLPGGGTREPVLRWHITVDHYGGEAKYPIGWPRVNRSLRESALRDWSGWDYLRLRVFTDTSRAALPREPVTLILHTPDKESSFNRPLDSLSKGAWTEVLIPLSAIPRHHDVRFFQLAISDSRYAHADRLDFYVDDICLLRHRAPVLKDFTPERAVLFSDARHLAAQFELLGVPIGEARDVTIELRQGETALARQQLNVPRGVQRALLDWSGGKLPPGECELVAQVAGNPTAVRAPVRVIESPWQEQP